MQPVAVPVCGYLQPHVWRSHMWRSFHDWPWSYVQRAFWFALVLVYASLGICMLSIGSSTPFLADMAAFISQTVQTTARGWFACVANTCKCQCYSFFSCFARHFWGSRITKSQWIWLVLGAFNRQGCPMMLPIAQAMLPIFLWTSLFKWVCKICGWQIRSTLNRNLNSCWMSISCWQFHVQDVVKLTTLFPGLKLLPYFPWSVPHVSHTIGSILILWTHHRPRKHPVAPKRITWTAVNVQSLN